MLDMKSSTCLRTSCLFAMLMVLSAAQVALAGQPNPPKLPSNVHVFSPSDPDIASVVQAAFAQNGGHDPPNNGQFNDARFTFMFTPGTYSVDVPVGYYTHVVGTGMSPDDVVFNGQKGVYCEEGAYNPSTGALDTFWRAAENFQTTSAFNWQTATGMMWAVSQAAPLRRVHVLNQLSLYEYQPPYPNAGYASGGYMSNCQIDGNVEPGSQQQFFTRNTKIGGKYVGGVWNHVFVGTSGAPGSHCGNTNGSPIVSVPQTPVIAEKPFITFDNPKSPWTLNIPSLRTDSVGPDWGAGSSVDFSNVYVANNVTDTATSINAMLSAGLSVVLTGGIYNLDAPIHVCKSGQVLLGLGYPTLVSSNGDPVITVDNVDGVRLAGPFLLQAGPNPTPTLLQWGDGTYDGNPANPGIMYDIFARVGGPDYSPVQAQSMVTINSGNVIIDGSWLWRADHTVTGIVKNSDNPCNNALLVRGDNVTAYGLAAEHTLQDLVQWSGNYGRTYFYQSELPYDVTQANFGDKGYVGYRVNNSVTAHAGYGIGVYHFMRDYQVTVQTGIQVPPQLISFFQSPLGVYLSGHGTMNHIIDSDGSPTSWTSSSGGEVKYYCP